MYAMYAVGYMTPLLATPTEVLPPELPLRIFLMIGYARCVALAKTSSVPLKNK